MPPASPDVKSAFFHRQVDNANEWLSESEGRIKTFIELCDQIEEFLIMDHDPNSVGNEPKKLEDQVADFSDYLYEIYRRLREVLLAPSSDKGSEDPKILALISSASKFVERCKKINLEKLRLIQGRKGKELGAEPPIDYPDDAMPDFYKNPTGDFPQISKAAVMAESYLALALQFANRVKSKFAA